METTTPSGSQQNLQQSQTQFQSNTQTFNVSNSSYANMARSTVQEQDLFPSREQAIVLNVVEELKLIDYVSKISDFVGHKNVTFASRISKNRICIFLSSVQLVDQIVKEHQVTEINGHPINIRRLITPARRIIISNVCPSIPHRIIENFIGQLGIVTTSPVSFLRAGLGRDRFEHIKSFRRQVYIQPDDNINLPSSILLKNGNTEHRIFLTFDELLCFACKQNGHIASRCPNQTVNPTLLEAPLNTNIQVNESINLLPETQDAEIEESPTPQGESLICTPSNSRPTKRPAISPVSSLIESIPDQNYTAVNQVQEPPFASPKTASPLKTKKKFKKSVSLESLNPVEELLSIDKNTIENLTPPLTLNWQQICDFFENVHGNPDPLSVARRYTDNIPAFLEMLQKLHGIVTSRSIKSKCTRLVKRISKQLYGDDKVSSDCETDSSQISSY